MNKKYNPFKIGQRLYKDGLGVSDIWGAVKSDSDMDEAFRGYEYEMTKAIKRAEQKEIKSKLGYSRIGLNNV
jgi:hypothetical protein